MWQLTRFARCFEEHRQNINVDGFFQKYCQNIASLRKHNVLRDVLGKGAPFSLVKFETNCDILVYVTAYIDNHLV